VAPYDPTHRALDVARIVAAFRANSALDKVDVFNLLVIPGVADQAAWGAAVPFCEAKRAFLIMDPPRNYAADGAGAPLLKIEDFASAIPLSKNAAFYFPYLLAPDPLTGDAVEVPPSGTIAGVFARTDNDRGVWKAPAGLETITHNVVGAVESGRMTDP